MTSPRSDPFRERFFDRVYSPKDSGVVKDVSGACVYLEMLSGIARQHTDQQGCSRSISYIGKSMREHCSSGYFFGRRIFFTAVIATSLIGCQPQKQGSAVQPSRQETQYLEHRVQFQGETLSVIANWYTGSGRNWELVLDANPGVDPRRIRLGDLIRIPRELLSRQDPLPRSAVPGAGGGNARAASSASASNAEVVSAEQPSSAETAAVVESEEVDMSASSNWNMTDDSADVVEEVVEPETAVVEDSPDSQDATSFSDFSDLEKQENEDSSVTEPVEDTTQNAPSEMRIKSRDELLKELLEE